MYNHYTCDQVVRGIKMGARAPADVAVHLIYIYSTTEANKPEEVHEYVYCTSYVQEI